MSFCCPCSSCNPCTPCNGDEASVPELLSAAKTMATFQCANPCLNPFQAILVQSGQHIKQLQADNAASNAANDELRAANDALQAANDGLKAEIEALTGKLGGCENALDCCQKSRVIQFVQPNCGFPCGTAGPCCACNCCK